MSNFQLPLSVTYDAEGATPIRDVITALEAADSAIQDAVSILPSLIDGLQIQQSHVNVRSLTQESPLRELFLVTLILAFQEDLNSEIPRMIEDIFRIEVNNKYDTILTVVTMVILFYGVGLIKDMVAKKLVQDGALKQQFDQMIEELSFRTGKTTGDIKKILDARYNKPNSVKSLAKSVKGFFIPAQREGAKAVTFDRIRIEPNFIREIPYPQEYEDKEDFQKFESYNEVVLEIHAQDKDKHNTGWAAVPKGIYGKRLRMKIIDPVAVEDIWNQDCIQGDITIISNLTPEGYIPSEIHLMKVYNDK